MVEYFLVDDPSVLFRIINRLGSNSRKSKRKFEPS